LEIFAGCARLSGAVRESGLLTGCPFELEHGDWFNITCPRILRLVLTWIRTGGSGWSILLRLAPSGARHERAGASTTSRPA